jgi:hypothetical protein
VVGVPEVKGHWKDAEKFIKDGLNLHPASGRGKWQTHVQCFAELRFEHGRLVLKWV